MEIWVCSQLWYYNGEFDCFGIFGVFSTREQAINALMAEYQPGQVIKEDDEDEEELWVITEDTLSSSCSTDVKIVFSNIYDIDRPEHCFYITKCEMNKG